MSAVDTDPRPAAGSALTPPALRDANDALTGALSRARDDLVARKDGIGAPDPDAPARAPVTARTGEPDAPADDAAARDAAEGGDAATGDVQEGGGGDGGGGGPDDAATARPGFFSRAVRTARFGLRILLVLINAAGLYLLLGMIATERIDDDTSFRPPEVTEGGLASVDMAAALIDREVANWTVNDPWILPGAWLGNMKAYQEGLLYGVGRFTLELTDSIGRARGATSVDPDLDRASGLLRFPGDVWIFDFEKTWTPTVTSEEQYASAARALRSWNQRAAVGQAVFDPRVDNLHGALQRIEADVSSQANALAMQVERLIAGEPHERSNRLFHAVKGRLYAYAMLLQALGVDYADIIRNERLELQWTRMIESMSAATSLAPLWVADAPPGGILVPSHTAELGFLALRAKTQLRDVMAVLRNE